MTRTARITSAAHRVLALAKIANLDAKGGKLFAATEKLARIEREIHELIDSLENVRS